MSNRNDLQEMRRALEALQTGDDCSLSLCFGFHRDPASGRSEWFSVRLPLTDRQAVLTQVLDEVTRLSIKDGHDDTCMFRVAASCTIPNECDHGWDVCPICDPCTC